MVKYGELAPISARRQATWRHNACCRRLERILIRSRQNAQVIKKPNSCLGCWMSNLQTNLRVKRRFFMEKHKTCQQVRRSRASVARKTRVWSHFGRARRSCRVALPRVKNAYMGTRLNVLSIPMQCEPRVNDISSQDDEQRGTECGVCTYRAVASLRRAGSAAGAVFHVELVADHAQLSPEFSLDREDGWR